ncbi:MAG TPA: MFS transporter [Gemmatimonadaceae bacterium]|nr:MFS transporter [Gemmatimonadaceae bacterium]
MSARGIPAIATEITESERSTPPAASPRRLPRTVRALALVSLLTDASSEMIYPLLPLFLTSVLHAGPGAIGVIEGAAETTASLLKLASGWWSDRVTRRKPIVVIGYTIASAVRPLVALAQGAGQVLAIRLTDRVGKGIRSSPRDALLADAVSYEQRGRAFGLHRAADHLGAVIGPLVAFSLLRWTTLSLRSLFLLAAIPGALAVLALVIGVRETARPAVMRANAQRPVLGGGLPGRFWAYLAVLLLFTLGNSSDAFLLLRASQLGVATALIPILWAMLHVVKSATSTPAGTLSDRVGRVPLIVSGWMIYALVYLAFGRAGATWQAWALFAVYGTYFGLTEGVEKALVADLVPAERRGAGFGWYNLAVGLGALPASVIFGAVWDRYGAPRAFELGAALSGVAAIALLVVLRGGQRLRRG